jgi:hypothetical protein
MTDLSKALAQPEHERATLDCSAPLVITPHPAFAAPPKREWVGLTDEESKPLIQKAMMYYGHNPDYWTLTAGAGFCIFAKAVEAKLKEKNA